MANCPCCGKEMNVRNVHITYEKGHVPAEKDDVVYVCNKGSCKGVLLPQSIFGVGP